MIKARNVKQFKEGDEVHVVYVDGYGWFVSKQAHDQLKIQIDTTEGVDGITGINLTVSEYLPYIYHEPKLVKDK